MPWELVACIKDAQKCRHLGAVSCSVAGSIHHGKLYLALGSWNRLQHACKGLEVGLNHPGPAASGAYGLVLALHTGLSLCVWVHQNATSSAPWQLVCIPAGIGVTPSLLRRCVREQA